MDRQKIALYLIVIALAPTLDMPWMVAIQAALGGLMIGIRLERLRLNWRYHHRHANP